MVDLKSLQEQILDNKAKHGWNITDPNEEICHIVSELAEVFDAVHKPDKDHVAEELADVVIYILGLAEMQGVDLEPALLKKIERNTRRKYSQLPDGTWIKEEL